jgi:lactate permease
MVVFNRTAKTSMAFGWLVVCTLAYFIWNMPVYWIVGASIRGVLTATNILVIVFGAIALYYCVRESGAMGRINEIIVGLSPDRRTQAILAWLLAAFVEGIAGFGTPGALVAPLLVSIGFPARIAVPLVLIFNSTPVSFGAVGLPTFGGIGYTLDIPSINSAVSAAGMDYWHWINHTVTTAIASIHGIVGIFLPLIGIIFLVKWSGGKAKDIIRAIPAALLGGVSFVIPFFITAYFIGPELASILGSVIGMLCYTSLVKSGLLKFQRPYEFTEKAGDEIISVPGMTKEFGLFKSVTPYLLISLVLICTRVIPQLNEFFSSNLVLSWENIYGTSTSFSFQALWNPGVYFILIVFLTHLIFKMDGESVRKVWKDTFRALVPAAIALWFAVALSQVMILSGNNDSGLSSMVSVIAGTTADITGRAYILVSPFIGILGAYIAGSNTVSNIMMAGFQYETATLLGIPRTIMLALQAVGGAVGNMICVHNVVAVCATVGIIGKEGSIIRRNIIPCLVYGIAAGVIGFFAVLVLPNLF